MTPSALLLNCLAAAAYCFVTGEETDILGLESNLTWFAFKLKSLSCIVPPSPSISLSVVVVFKSGLQFLMKTSIKEVLSIWFHCGSRIRSFRRWLRWRTVLLPTRLRLMPSRPRRRQRLQSHHCHGLLEWFRWVPRVCRVYEGGLAYNDEMVFLLMNESMMYWRSCRYLVWGKKKKRKRKATWVLFSISDTGGLGFYYQKPYEWFYSFQRKYSL